MMKSKIIGKIILALMTIFLLFFGFYSVTLLSYTSSFLINIIIFISVITIAIVIYYFGVISVARKFNVELEVKLTKLSPSCVAFLNFMLPGVGFIYIGRRKNLDYIKFGRLRP